MYFMRHLSCIQNQNSEYGEEYLVNRGITSGEQVRGNLTNVSNFEVIQCDIYSCFIQFCWHFIRLVRNREKVWKKKRFEELCDKLQNEMAEKCTEDTLEWIRYVKKDAENLQNEICKLITNIGTYNVSLLETMIYIIVENMYSVATGLSLLRDNINNSLELAASVDTDTLCHQVLCIYKRCEKNISESCMRTALVSILKTQYNKNHNIFSDLSTLACVCSQLFAETEKAIMKAQKKIQRLPLDNTHTKERKHIKVIHDSTLRQNHKQKAQNVKPMHPSIYTSITNNYSSNRKYNMPDQLNSPIQTRKPSQKQKNAPNAAIHSTGAFNPPDNEHLAVVPPFRRRHPLNHSSSLPPPHISPNTNQSFPNPHYPAPPTPPPAVPIRSTSLHHRLHP